MIQVRYRSGMPGTGAACLVPVVYVRVSDFPDTGDETEQSASRGRCQAEVSGGGRFP